VPKPPPPHQFKVGDRIKAKIAGQVVDATIRAVVEHADGLKLQVDFGNEQTALVALWQVLQD